MAVTPLSCASRTETETAGATSQLASAVALAYATVDYRHPDEWLSSVKDDCTPETFGTLKERVQPVIWTRFRQDRTISAGKIAAQQQIAGGIDPGVQRAWQVWEVSVELDQPWPAEPSANLEPLPIPWPRGQTLTMYLTLLETDAGWRFAMFTPGAVVESLRGRP